jgi:hypothetical protein
LPSSRLLGSLWLSLWGLVFLVGISAPACSKRVSRLLGLFHSPRKRCCLVSSGSSSQWQFWNRETCSNKSNRNTSWTLKINFLALKPHWK